MRGIVLVLVLVLAACPDRRAVRVEDSLTLPAVREATATATLAPGTARHIALAADGRIWVGNRRTALAELGAARVTHPRDRVALACHFSERGMTPPPMSDAARGHAVTGGRGRRGEGSAATLAVGEVTRTSPLAQDTLIYAARDASARTLVDLVLATGGGIMVQHDRIVPLGLDFRDDPLGVAHPAGFATLRLAPATDVQRVLDETPHTTTWCDHEVIFPVDLLVEEYVTVQQLVDAIVVLDRAGVRMIGLGKAG